MKYLKKINELFDTEELKSENEIDYLSGQVFKGHITLDIKNENIAKLLHKIYRFNLPFIKAFIDRVEDGIELKTMKIDTIVGDEGYFILKSTMGRKTVALGIKVETAGEYDCFLFWEINDDPSGYEYEKLSYSELIDIFELYKDKLIQFGMHELVEYDSPVELN
jgi:hypothetical protein